jgi:hypothetical protein
MFGPPRSDGVSGSIFLIRGDTLVELRPTGYASEAVLQELIARYPNLLAGDDSGGAAARRWLLLGRESGLPDQDDGAARWAVDHLLLDQDAIPTILEVKLAHDTGIRREVVGQMLDYAANAVVYWPIERLRERFVRECTAAGRDPAALVAEAAGEERVRVNILGSVPRRTCAPASCGSSLSPTRSRASSAA